jgi:hemolysin D
VPQGFVKIVQPTDSGVVREILVREGDRVAAGQTLVRMDSRLSDADRDALGGQLALKRLQLRRIDAELAAVPLDMQDGDAPDTFAQVSAQYHARRLAHLDAVGAETALLAKAKADYAASLEMQIKLKQSAPIYKEQAQAWAQLARDGFAGKLLALERKRVHLESEQDLLAQNATVRSLKAQVQQAENRLAQIVSQYREGLQNERVATQSEVDKLAQDWEKQTWRQEKLELKAPQDGIIKELATHTVGSVVQPGSVLMTLVPTDEPLQAEVWIRHTDAGFVKADQSARIKVSAFPFQKYGLVEGRVRRTPRVPTRNRPGTTGVQAKAIVRWWRSPPRSSSAAANVSR